MPQKKQIKLETEINEIVIINNKKLTPYIELVNFSSRNIDQKKLGTILGIFEIKDTSEDSAYIVNFLSSVAKKTYFASHQKSPEESFESTLAKVNLSLSEVAKHGNINWIGKIDAVLCSVFENQINFSVSGDAKVLLLRNGKLTEISAGLSPKDEAANPLKTFTDIASGRLETNDKLILTTDDISHIFSLDDLEKYATSFKNEKFLRFLKTALVNELDIAGTIVIDTKKTSAKRKEKSAKKTVDKSFNDEFNLFGNKAFKETDRSKKETSVSEILAEKDKKKEYINKQTGHIYISDTNENYENFHEDKIGQLLDNFKEHFSDFNYWFKNKYLKGLGYKFRKGFNSLLEKKSPSQKSENLKESSYEITPPASSNLSKKLRSISSDLKDKTKKISAPKWPVKAPLSQENISNNFTQNIPIAKTSTINSKFFINKESSIAFFQKTIEQILVFLNFLYLQTKRFFKLIKKTFPHLSKLKRLFLKMSPKMKIITLLVISFIIITPLILMLRDGKPAETTPAATISDPNKDLPVNPSTQSYKETSTLYESSDLLGTFVFDNTVFAISKNKITELGGENKDYNFPDNFKDAQFYSFMNDLNLLFLINTKNQIISFSPISLKFKEDSISIQSGVKIEGIGTYLTYLYLVDSNGKQIYRYPRADNGFGEKLDWLSSDVSFENITGLAIDGNVYLAKRDSVLKLFNRKTQDFSLKIDTNSSIDEIFTHEDLTNIYVLDNLNGELDKFDKNGNKIGFVSNQNLTKANKIWIDEKNSAAYFIAEKSLYKISLP